MLLDGHRVIGSTLDGGVIGHEQALTAGNAADAGDDARGGCVAGVEVPGGQGRKLQEGRTGVEQAVDAFTHEELALFGVALLGLLAAAAAHRC